MARQKPYRIVIFAALYHSILRQRYALDLCALFWETGASIDEFDPIPKNHLMHMHLHAE